MFSMSADNYLVSIPHKHDIALYEVSASDSRIDTTMPKYEVCRIIFQLGHLHGVYATEEELIIDEGWIRSEQSVEYPTVYLHRDHS